MAFSPTPCSAVYAKSLRSSASEASRPSGSTATRTAVTYFSMTKLYEPSTSRLSSTQRSCQVVGSRFCMMAASISASTGGTIWQPSPHHTLYPLSAGGLWLAVTMTPAAARSSTTPKGTSGVWQGVPSHQTLMPRWVKAAAASCA